MSTKPKISAIENIPALMAQARAEITASIREIDKTIAQLTRDKAGLVAELERMGGGGAKANGSKRQYGGVREAVIEAVKAAGRTGIKPAGIVAATGLASPQVHNALTGLKKTKDVKPKDGLYFAV